MSKSQQTNQPLSVENLCFYKTLKYILDLYLSRNFQTSVYSTFKFIDANSYKDF